MYHLWQQSVNRKLTCKFAICSHILQEKRCTPHCTPLFFQFVRESLALGHLLAERAEQILDDSLDGVVALLLANG